MGKLAGKVALVTGASRGIGRAIAQILSEAGAQILVVHRDSAAGAEETFRGLSGKGHRVIQASVIDSDALRAAAASAAQIEGRLDILVKQCGYVKSGTPS